LSITAHFLITPNFESSDCSCRWIGVVAAWSQLVVIDFELVHRADSTAEFVAFTAWFGQCLVRINFECFSLLLDFFFLGVEAQLGVLVFPDADVVGSLGIGSGVPDGLADVGFVAEEQLVLVFAGELVCHVGLEGQAGGLDAREDVVCAFGLGAEALLLRVDFHLVQFALAALGEHLQFVGFELLTGEHQLVHLVRGVLQLAELARGHHELGLPHVLAFDRLEGERAVGLYTACQLLLLLLLVGRLVLSHFALVVNALEELVPVFFVFDFGFQ